MCVIHFTEPKKVYNTNRRGVLNWWNSYSDRKNIARKLSLNVTKYLVTIFRAIFRPKDRTKNWHLVKHNVVITFHPFLPRNWLKNMFVAVNALYKLVFKPLPGDKWMQSYDLLVSNQMYGSLTFVTPVAKKYLISCYADLLRWSS